MSTKLRKESFINYLFPYKFKFRKNTIINFLSEIYANIHKRCNKMFDSYVFQELMRLPMIVCNKIYSTVTSKHKNQMTVDIFSTNIYNIFFGDIDDKMSMMFDVFDFDDDGSIIYEDVFLILSHLHLIEYTNDTVQCLEIIISNFFDNKTKIDKDNCFNINKNYDVLLLLLIYLNKYQSLISEQEISFYEASIKKNKNVEPSNFLYSFSYKQNGINDYNELEYKPTNALLDYLDIIDFGKKKKNIIEEQDDEDDFFENEDDDDLNALFNFSMDFKELKERFINKCNLEPRLFTSTFSSMFQEEKARKKKREEEINKQVNEIIKNQMYNSIKKEKIQKYEYKKIRTQDSYANERATQLNSTIVTDLENGQDFKKTNSFVNNSVNNYSLIKKINIKCPNKCEIILKKENGKSKKKLVKFILVNKYIFYFISFNNIDFLYKKIIPIVNLFIHKKKVDNIGYIKLISQGHNTTTIKEFSSEDYAKVSTFCSKFNSINYQRDITKDYYFKYEVDQGKFGHVFLARSNTKNKKYAIKMVQKNNQSFEEYKINRNEIDIFLLLKNLKHPNIVECIDLYENESQIFFVFEYLPYGNLKKYIQDIKFLSSEDSIDIILKLSFQLIEGAYILHKYGIIHRDIKTTNLMIQMNSHLKNSGISTSIISETQKIHEDITDFTLKIIDFGLSKIMGLNEKTNEPYGSLSYKAPELILQKEYNFKVDVWSIGITIYFIVYKMLPFDEGSRKEIKNAIVNKPVPFLSNNLLHDITYLKDLINNQNINNYKSSIIYSILKDCLIKNPVQRYSIEELYYKYCNIL
jgi:hypothetical protein